MTSEQYNEIQKIVYRDLKDNFDKKMSEGYLPNVSGIKKEILSLKRKIKRVTDGACFARNMEEVDKTEHILARLMGQLKAYQDILSNVNERIKEVCG